MKKKINAINSLKAEGGTNIYAGLAMALDLITDNYKSGEQVAAMILLNFFFFN